MASSLPTVLNLTLERISNLERRLREGLFLEGDLGATSCDNEVFGRRRDGIKSELLILDRAQL